MAFLLLFIGALLAGCTDLDKDQVAGKGPVKELPLSEYKDTVILDMYEGSRKSWVLRTRHLVKWPRTDLVKAKPVDLVVFDSLEKQAVKVTADSGSVDEAISFLAATGHVHAKSVKGVEIWTDSLRWNKSLDQINTEARVRVVSEEGDVLTGRGFVSDAKLDNWQILADVKGVFHKVEERFQKADQDTSKPPESATSPPQPTLGNPSQDAGTAPLDTPSTPHPAMPADTAGQPSP